MRGVAGSIMLIASAIGFGFMPLFRSWAQQGGCGLYAMLFLRFAAAGVLLGMWCIFARKRLPRLSVLLVLIGMGAVLYVGESFAYFKALDVGTSPALVALLLYAYPAIVTLFSRVLFREPLTPARLAAVALAIVGTLLAVWGPVEETPALGIVLGLLTAVTYAAYILIGSRLPRELDPAVSSAVVICSTAVVYAVLTIATDSPRPTAPIGWLGVACLALISTVMSLTLFLAGLRLVGPVRASTLSTVEALSAVIVAWAFMGEPLMPVQMVGGAMIIAAAVWTARTAVPMSEPETT